MCVVEGPRPGDDRPLPVMPRKGPLQDFGSARAQERRAAHAQPLDEAGALHPLEVVGDGGPGHADAAGQRGGVGVGFGQQGPQDEPRGGPPHGGKQGAVAFAAVRAGKEEAGLALEAVALDEAMAHEEVEMVLDGADGEPEVAGDLAQVDARVLADVLDDAAPVGHRQEAALEAAGIPGEAWRTGGAWRAWRAWRAWPWLVRWRAWLVHGGAPGEPAGHGQLRE